MSPALCSLSTAAGTLCTQPVLGMHIVQALLKTLARLCPAMLIHAWPYTVETCSCRFKRNKQVCTLPVQLPRLPRMAFGPFVPVMQAMLPACAVQHHTSQCVIAVHFMLYVPLGSYAAEGRHVQAVPGQPLPLALRKLTTSDSAASSSIRTLTITTHLL